MAKVQIKEKTVTTRKVTITLPFEQAEALTILIGYITDKSGTGLADDLYRELYDADIEASALEKFRLRNGQLVRVDEDGE